MSSFSSIYTSLTGLISYSDALSVLSDDIANLNTPGFKGNNVLFGDIPPTPQYFEGGSGSTYEFSLGNGVIFSGTERSFVEGAFNQTGNATDLAITGDGFFVLRQDGQLVYSQSGQFTFDDNGYLVDSTTKARVQAIDANDNLSDLKIDTKQISAAVPSTTVTFTGNLNSSGTTDSVTVSNVIDSTGTAHTLTVAFTKDTTATTSTGTAWDVSVTDETGKTLIQSGLIKFDGSGDPVAGFNTLSLSEGGSNITLNFGTPGVTTGATSLSSSSNTLTGTADGSAVGSLTGVTINTSGVVELAFSNAQTVNGPQLALANFSDPQELINIGKSDFIADDTKSGATPTYGQPGTGALGQITAGELELSNVNLSQEFSTIVVLQNGYQGSSQVLNVANQLLDDLYKSVGGAG